MNKLSQQTKKLWYYQIIFIFFVSSLIIPIGIGLFLFVQIGNLYHDLTYTPPTTITYYSEHGDCYLPFEHTHEVK